MKALDRIKAYVKERDEILLKDDQEAFTQWCKLKGRVFQNQESAEITRHKCITACESLPKELKARSHKWLIDRGYTPWD